MDAVTSTTTPTPGVDAAAVDAAAARLEGLLAPTPVTESGRLSAKYGATVVLKREDQQPVRSYKIRGASNLIAQLDEDARAAGVVCASAGNHAQGVAYACARLGVKATIFLPRTTPRQKRERVRVLGGPWVTTVVEGDTYDVAAAAAGEFATTTGATLVPAFDDVRTIAGQGTVAREAFAQCEIQHGRVPDVVVVPVGGGGLLAGTTAWVRERHPNTRIVGVEPVGAPSLQAALAAGRPVSVPVTDPFVDGATVGLLGAHTYPVIAAGEVPCFSVAEGRICTEMLDLYQSDGIIAEPAGALASSALDDVEIADGELVLAILSGGNNDVSRYAEVVERSLVYEGRKHYFLVEFPQEPGQLRRFLNEILGPEDDITLFEYTKRSNRETGPALVGLELGEPAGLEPLLERMAESAMRTERVDPDSPLFRMVL
ncbi:MULTISPECIES: threonine ammonia-lyase IlvA [unclassified Dermacoccus]|uniref:threonine ammonia-lyase IlvA n=1 Tax=unclassified Dermacoccus TaxID=2643059 RepID=UPI00101CE4B3|nr:MULTISPECIES: threonine ammonia-lyase IlvA [unclassified Dermacoccus]MBZ4497168.1 threonine ammonia-lyase IlvA [Dermacoccus sp. Tok2021]RYI21493.1 threonine dehydratase [Dermacoccus sp. 147Ba]